MVPRPRPWLADSDECGLARLQGSGLTISGSNQPIELTLFPNGRAIVKGTTELNVARSLYAKYVGG